MRRNTRVRYSLRELDDEVGVYLQERAKAKGIEVNRLVNDMLKRDIDLIEAVK
ncbi:hypothetical protein [Methylocaldum sp. GT1TLB]|jgi:hypothetical protein|uniref:hypothetical protein n=1 Tax=Methylocaldum sp. GT1TLB TaxID=3438965 RepID=UPI003D9FD642